MRSRPQSTIQEKAREIQEEARHIREENEQLREELEALREVRGASEKVLEGASRGEIPSASQEPVERPSWCRRFFWVRVSSMRRLVDALILLLWLLALVSAVTALWFEERRGFLILALIFGSLAAYMPLTGVLAKPEKVFWRRLVQGMRGA